MNLAAHLKFYICFTVLINAAAMFSPIINSGDAITYATLAHHMVLSNDWTRLILDNRDWLDKPHFPFWITAFFFKIGGVSAFTYVLPGFIFHLIGAYYTYRLTRLLYDQPTALISVLIYVSIFNLMDASIEVKAETYLTGQIMPACYYWLRYDQRYSLKYLLLGAVFTAMALMTKGVFTLFTIASGLVCVWAYQKQLNKLISLKWWAALILSLLLVAPELLALHLQFDQDTLSSGAAQPVSSFKFFFWDSQFGRFFNTGPIQNHNGHPFYFVLVFLWAFLPWTTIFFAALSNNINKFKALALTERSTLIFLCGSFFCTFLMFSATKFQLDYYIDILLPFAAILSARFLYLAKLSRLLFLTQIGLITFIVLLALALTIYVMNTTLLATIVGVFIGMMVYIHTTRMEAYNFKVVTYSTLAINMLYIFIALLTLLAFTQYSVAHNAVKIFGKQSTVPIYVYQLPEVARELALYSEAQCIEIESTESLNSVKGNYYLIANHDQLQQLQFYTTQFELLKDMQLVVHKTGTFNKLLQLAKGTRPLETITFMRHTAIN